MLRCWKKIFSKEKLMWPKRLYQVVRVVVADPVILWSMYESWYVR